MWLKPKVGLHNKRNFEQSRNYNNEYCVHFTRFFCNIWHFYWRFVSDWLWTSNYHIYIRGVIDSVVTIFITGGFEKNQLTWKEMNKSFCILWKLIKSLISCLTLHDFRLSLNVHHNNAAFIWYVIWLKHISNFYTLIHHCCNNTWFYIYA